MEHKHRNKHLNQYVWMFVYTRGPFTKTWETLTISDSMLLLNIHLQYFVSKIFHLCDCVSVSLCVHVHACLTILPRGHPEWADSKRITHQYSCEFMLSLMLQQIVSDQTQSLYLRPHKWISQTARECEWEKQLSEEGGRDGENRGRAGTATDGPLFPADEKENLEKEGKRSYRWEEREGKRREGQEKRRGNRRCELWRYLSYFGLTNEHKVSWICPESAEAKLNQPSLRVCLCFLWPASKTLWGILLCDWVSVGLDVCFI